MNTNADNADPTAAELDDLRDARTLDWSLVDRSVLTHPILLRAAAGIVVVGVFLLWPERGQVALTRLIAGGLVVTGLLGVVSQLRLRSRDMIGVASALATIAVGVILLVVGRQRPEVLGRTLGVLLLLAGSRDVLRGWLHERQASQVAQGAALLAAGAALLAFPSGLLTVLAIAFGTGWALLGAAGISVTLNPHTPSLVDYDDSHHLLDAWFQDRPKRASSRQGLYDKILFEGDDTGRRVIRFVVLMSFASVIASMGVINDSTAVVIGAMLIAPLMTPLMGMAISLVMGWPRRLGRSSSMAAAGILLAIMIGLILGLTVPGLLDTTTNSQILSRTSPTQLDLIVAVAAGAAGAYALSRPDVSDSLPGVAIAISLVPPLTVVGISYSQGDWDAGNGALLLYATNMVAILVVGGLTFIVTGVTPLSRVTDNQARLRTWGLAVGVAAVLVIGSLFLNGAQLTRDAFADQQVSQVVDDWLESFDRHNVVSAQLDDDLLTAVIVGPTDGAPKALSLAELASSEFGRDMTADVRLVVEEREVATSPAG